MADQNERLELRIDINAQTPVTQATQGTLNSILAFPGQFATAFLMKAAIISWGFNQMKQAGEFFYGWWRERQEQMRQEMEKFRKELQGLTPSTGPGEVRIMPSLAKYGGIAAGIGPSVKTTDIAALDKVIRDAVTKQQYNENWLIGAARAKYAGGGEAADTDTVAMMRAIYSGMDVSELQASAIATGLQKTMSGRTAGLFGAFARNLSRAGGAMEKGEIEPFVYMMNLMTYSARPELRSGQAAQAFLNNMRQRMSDPRRQAGVERLLGEQFTDAGQVRDIEALQKSLTHLQQTDPKAYRRVTGELVTNNLAVGALDLLVGMGYEDTQASRGALEDARSSLAVLRTPWLAFQKQREALAAFNEQATAKDIGAAQEQFAKLRKPPREWIQGEAYDIATGIENTMRAEGRWFPGAWTQPKLKGVVSASLADARAAGLDPTASAEALVASISRYMEGLPYESFLYDVKSREAVYAGPYAGRIPELADLIARDRGTAPPGMTQINYFAVDRMSKALGSLAGSRGLNLMALGDLARSAVDLMPVH